MGNNLRFFQIKCLGEKEIFVLFRFGFCINVIFICLAAFFTCGGDIGQHEVTCMGLEVGASKSFWHVSSWLVLLFYPRSDRQSHFCLMITGMGFLGTGVAGHIWYSWTTFLLNRWVFPIHKEKGIACPAQWPRKAKYYCSSDLDSKASKNQIVCDISNGTFKEPVGGISFLFS